MFVNFSTDKTELPTFKFVLKNKAIRDAQFGIKLNFGTRYAIFHCILLYIYTLPKGKCLYVYRNLLILEKTHKLNLCFKVSKLGKQEIVFINRDVKTMCYKCN